jgi:branched-chain amino acid transport system ATP-binding protein
VTSTLDALRPGDTVPVENALTISGLRAGYGRTQVLRDVSLTVPAGQVTALLGPNGAGKSTLLRTVCGFIPASHGKVTLFGQDVTKQSPYRRFAQGLCHIPEGRGVFRGLTVRENLVMQGGRGREKPAIERAAAAFPILRKRLKQTAGTLSGGEQQMLAMAAAYVRDPKIVLVDEASLGLAPILVDEIFEFLHRLTDEGGSLLLVDQFATRALSMAKSVYIMRRGEISYSGDAQSLMDSDVFAHYVNDPTGVAPTDRD